MMKRKELLLLLLHLISFLLSINAPAPCMRWEWSSCSKSKEEEGGWGEEVKYVCVFSQQQKQTKARGIRPLLFFVFFCFFLFLFVRLFGMIDWLILHLCLPPMWDRDWLVLIKRWPKRGNVGKYSSSSSSSSRGVSPYSAMFCSL